MRIGPIASANCVPAEDAGRGSAVACGFSDFAELLLDGAQLFGYRVEARIKSAWAVLKHALLRARGVSDQTEENPLAEGMFQS